MRLVRWIATLEAGFVGLTAVGGGLAIVAGLEDFPPEWLHGTPFSSYELPGLLLASLVGLPSLLAAAALFRGWRGAPWAAVAAGALTAGWIAGEVAILNQPSAPTPIEVFYLLLGASVATGGLLLARSDTLLVRRIV